MGRYSDNPYERVQGMGTGAYYTPGFGYSVGGPFGGWHNTMGAQGGGGIGQLPDGSFFGGSRNSLAGMISAGLQGGNILNHTQYMMYDENPSQFNASGAHSEYVASSEEQEQVAGASPDGEPFAPNPMTPPPPPEEGEEWFDDIEGWDEASGSGYGLGPYDLPNLLGMRGVEGRAWFENTGGGTSGTLRDGAETGSVKGYGYPGQSRAGGYGSLRGTTGRPSEPPPMDADSRRQSVLNLRRQAY